MKTSLWELQKAIYGRLSTDIELNNTITGAYDEVSADASKPYITMGEPFVTPFTTKLSYGENVVVALHVWSDYNGKKPIYDIFNLTLKALHEPLNIGGSFLMLKRDLVSMNVLNDPVENGVKHGVMELRFYINN